MSTIQPPDQILGHDGITRHVLTPLGFVRGGVEWRPFYERPALTSIDECNVYRYCICPYRYWYGDLKILFGGHGHEELLTYGAFTGMWFTKTRTIGAC
jgi:hypothetical protein